MESFTFFLPLTLLYLVGMTVMASKLKNINDAFKIKNEICYTIVATGITLGERLSLTREGSAFSTITRFSKFRENGSVARRDALGNRCCR